MESCHSTIGQKKAVLDVLHSVCSHPQTLVDIFLNYDCDIEDPCDVFERMVNDLSAITKVIFCSFFLSFFLLYCLLTFFPGKRVQCG